jgi:hypothetical protein
MGEREGEKGERKGRLEEIEKEKDRKEIEGERGQNKGRERRKREKGDRG